VSVTRIMLHGEQLRQKFNFIIRDLVKKLCKICCTQFLVHVADTKTKTGFWTQTNFIEL